VCDEFFFKRSVVFSMIPAAQMRKLMGQRAENGRSSKRLSRIV
jgi:hypothetical protein